jgi:PAS domain S-box-containing protein
MDSALFLVGCGALVSGVLGASCLFRCRERRIREQAHQLHQAADEATHASNRRWELLFEQSPISVQIFNPEGQTIRVNAAWRNLFHLTEAQALSFNVLKDPDLNASGAVNLIRLGFEGQVVNVPPVPYPVNTDPPQIRWIGGVLYPVKDSDGRLLEVVTVHHDITETKRAEEAMLSLNQTLEQRVAERTAELETAHEDLHRALATERELSELKSRFVSIVSHEFRTPLGVTMSAVEVLRHYDEKLTPENRRELCDDIHSATRNMAGLMEHVLLLGRVEAGKLVCKPLPVQLDATFAKFIDEQRSATQQKCPIELKLDNDVAGAVADETLLQHIFGNLISNAVKYSPEGETVVVRLRRNGVDAICSIIDRGIGIPEKDMEHLFEAFNRASNVGDIPGTGLGLVIVKRCVEFHGGTISIDTTPGQGTTFAVTLPLFRDGE